MLDPNERRGHPVVSRFVGVGRSSMGEPRFANSVSAARAQGQPDHGVRPTCLFGWFEGDAVFLPERMVRAQGPAAIRVGVLISLEESLPFVGRRTADRATSSNQREKTPVQKTPPKKAVRRPLQFAADSATQGP